METLDNFNALLYNNFDENRNVFIEIVLYGQILGAITALLSTAHIVYKSFYGGQPLNMGKIYFVIAISISLALYQPITNILLNLTDAFSVGLSLASKKEIIKKKIDLITILSWENDLHEQSTKNNSVKKDNLSEAVTSEKLEEEILSMVYKQAPRSAEDFNSENNKNSSQGQYNWNQESFNQSLLTLLTYGSQGAIMGLYVLRHIILFVLFLLGPIVLSLSLIHFFQYSISFWVAKYISVSLWLPIAYAVELILISIFEKLKIDNINNEMALSSFSMKVFFSVFTIIAHLSIPMIAYWIFDKSLMKKWT